jgi:hypothetical protein
MKDYKNEFYIDETGEYAQVVRWNLSNNIPPKDMLEDFWRKGYITLGTLSDSIACKNAEDSKFLEQYIASRKKYGYSDEEKFEMRAAFGDEEVVDLFTGERVEY